MSYGSLKIRVSVVRFRPWPPIYSSRYGSQNDLQFVVGRIWDVSSRVIVPQVVVQLDQLIGREFIQWATCHSAEIPYINCVGRRLVCIKANMPRLQREKSDALALQQR